MIEENNLPSNELLDESETCCSKSSCCAPQSPFKRVAEKVGRNDPCPCGSQRKYKKCCGR